MNETKTSKLATETKAPVVATSKSQNVPRESNERILYEKALAAQAEYLKAPAGFVSESGTDEFAELARIYAPESVDKRDATGRVIEKAPRHAYFGETTTRDVDISRGYVPVYNQNGDPVRGPGGMYLYTIPTERYERQQEVYAKESRSRLQMSTQMTKSTLPGGAQAQPGDVKEDYLSIKSGGGLEEMNEN